MRLRRILIGSSLLLMLMSVGGFLYLKSLGVFSGQAVYADATGAIGGYDPVAYFAQGQAVPGEPQFHHVWNGAKWLFSSAENRDAFAADPAKYAPQFGGYCAYAVSEGYTANSDPTVWSVVDDRLYLNYNEAVAERWSAEQAVRIQTAQKNWPEMRPAGP